MCAWLADNSLEALEALVRVTVREALHEMLEEHRDSIRETVSAALRDALTALYTRREDPRGPAEPEASHPTRE